MGTAVRSGLPVAVHPQEGNPRWKAIAGWLHDGLRLCLTRILRSTRIRPGLRSMAFLPWQPSMMWTGLLRFDRIAGAFCQSDQPDDPDAEETKDKGSELPVRRATERSARQPHPVDAEQSRTASPGTPHPEPQQFSGRVLLAEDESVNQLFASELFRSLGLMCDVACNGQEAVKAFSQNRYAIVFRDCPMPVMDGVAAAEQMRQFERSAQRRRTPIIALTAGVPPADILGGKESSIDDYLTKPIGCQQLREVLDRWLPKR